MKRSVFGVSVLSRLKLLFRFAVFVGRPHSLKEAQLIHDKDEQSQEQKSSQDGQSHHPSRDRLRALGGPDHLQRGRCCAGWELRIQVFIRHLDDAEGGGGANIVRFVLTFSLEKRAHGESGVNEENGTLAFLQPADPTLDLLALRIPTIHTLQVLFLVFVLQVSAVDAVCVPPLSAVSAGRRLIFVNKSGILGESKHIRVSQEYYTRS